MKHADVLTRIHFIQVASVLNNMMAAQKPDENKR